MHVVVKPVTNPEIVKRANVFHDSQAQAGAVGIAAFVKTFENSILVKRSSVACILKTKSLAL